MNKIAQLALTLCMIALVGCGPISDDEEKKFKAFPSERESSKVLAEQLQYAKDQLDKSSEELAKAKTESTNMALERDKAKAERDKALDFVPKKAECEDLVVQLSEAQTEAKMCKNARSRLSTLKDQEHRRAEDNFLRSAELADELEHSTAEYEAQLLDIQNENNNKEEDLRAQLETSEKEFNKRNTQQEQISAEYEKTLEQLKLEKHDQEHKNTSLENKLLRSLQELKKARESIDSWRGNHDLVLLEKAKQRLRADENQDEVERLRWLLEERERTLALKIKELEKTNIKSTLQGETLLQQEQELRKLLRENQSVMAENLSLGEKVQEILKKLELAEQNNQSVSLEEVLLEHKPCEEALAQSFLLEMHKDEEKLASKIADSWCILPDEIDQDSNALITYERNFNEVKLGINAILSPSNYQDILSLNDLSYAVAKEMTVVDNKKLTLVKQRITNTDQELIQKKWIRHKTILGKTGRNNINDDKTCIIYHNPQENLIVISFHGSRSGSMMLGAFYNDGQGDWGANYDFNYVKGDFLGPQGQQLKHIPSDIELHRGFTNNFLSAQDELLYELEQILGSYQQVRPWVIVTGHSKGGAMASIAAPIIKLQVGDRAHIGAILFSSPRAFHGGHSRQWVHKIVGKRNILRVNVYGDPATQMPRESFGYSYRSLGMLALDLVNGVESRIQKIAGQGLSYSDVKGCLGRYHYGFARPEGFGFEPKLVMPFEELIPGLEVGRLHMSEGGPKIMTQSFIQK